MDEQDCGAPAKMPAGPAALARAGGEKRDTGEMFLDIHDPKTFWNEKVLVVVVTR